MYYMVTRTQPLETEHRKSPWRSGARPDPRPALCCAHHDGTARADYPLARAPLLVPPRGAPLSPMRVAGLGTSTIGTSLIGSDIPHAFGCINKPLVPCCASVGLGHFTNGPFDGLFVLPALAAMSYSSASTLVCRSTFVSGSPTTQSHTGTANWARCDQRCGQRCACRTDRHTPCTLPARCCAAFHAGAERSGAASGLRCTS